MPASLQVKLLRALQEHEVVPVGSSVPVGFDARIIAATNRNLEEQVAEGRFREDLFYRLNVVEIFVPPLRERREDIPLLIRHFLTKAAKNQRAGEKAFDSEAMTAMGNYSWPGNVRELENTIERAVILSGDEIELENLPARISQESRNAFATRDMDGFRPTLEEIERRYVLEVLKNVGEDKASAANILGIDLSTLYRKLKRYDELAEINGRKAPE